MVGVGRRLVLGGIVVAHVVLHAATRFVNGRCFDNDAALGMDEIFGDCTQEGGRFAARRCVDTSGVRRRGSGGTGERGRVVGQRLPMAGTGSGGHMTVLLGDVE